MDGLILAAWCWPHLIIFRVKVKEVVGFRGSRVGGAGLDLKCLAHKTMGLTWKA